MKQPKKWKDTVDPFSIQFNNFKLIKVLGYPHARNDVFYCVGKFNNKRIKCFLKYASKQESNISHEIETIKTLNFCFLPQIVYCDENGKFIVTKEIDGERLSYILQKHKKENSIDYMFEYGKTLAEIHLVKKDFPKVKHRKFFDIPTIEYLKENQIDFIYDYLQENKPETTNECFCHGDFHYANILWKKRKLVAVLDWELSGIGNKEFDIAWAIINRPSQKFLKTQQEVDKFLEGYQSLNSCNIKHVKYYMLLIYSHFISVNKNNFEYQEFVKNFLSQTIKKELSV